MCWCSWGFQMLHFCFCNSISIPFLLPGSEDPIKLRQTAQLKQQMQIALRWDIDKSDREKCNFHCAIGVSISTISQSWNEKWNKINASRIAFGRKKKLIDQHINQMSFSRFECIVPLLISCTTFICFISNFQLIGICETSSRSRKASATLHF